MGGETRALPQHLLHKVQVVAGTATLCTLSEKFYETAPILAEPGVKYETELEPPVATTAEYMEVFKFLQERYLEAN